MGDMQRLEDLLDYARPAWLAAARVVQAGILRIQALIVRVLACNLAVFADALPLCAGPRNVGLEAFCRTGACTDCGNDQPQLNGHRYRRGDINSYLHYMGH